MASSIIKADAQVMCILKKAGKLLLPSSQNHVINVDSTAKGEGIMGDIYGASIKDNTGGQVKLVVKQAPKDKLHREQSLIDLAYKNEIHFYSTVVPQLKKFEKDHNIAQSGVRVTDFVVSENTPGKELIVLKDLNNTGYVLKDKHKSLDDNHLKVVFEHYGRFHATSFCLKKKKPEEFQKLIAPFQNMWEKNLSNDSFVESYRGLVETTVRVLNPMIYPHIHEKLKPYYESAESLKKLFLGAVKYTDNFGCILHGDCSSNNIMFKYDESSGAPKSLKFLDFQLAGFGSPVQDLSYFLLIGASQLHFGHWEKFLKIYHASFTGTVNHYKEDVEKLLSKEKLFEDWKTYSKSSMLLSLLLLKMKFLRKDDTLQLVEKFKVTPSDNRNLGFSALNYDTDLFVLKMKNIFQHMYAINGL